MKKRPILWSFILFIFAIISLAAYSYFPKGVINGYHYTVDNQTWFHHPDGHILVTDTRFVSHYNDFILVEYTNEAIEGGASLTHCAYMLVNSRTLTFKKFYSLEDSPIPFEELAPFLVDPVYRENDSCIITGNPKTGNPPGSVDFRDENKRRRYDVDLGIKPAAKPRTAAEEE